MVSSEVWHCRALLASDGDKFQTIVAYIRHNGGAFRTGAPTHGQANAK
jgi:hypothetical protein